MTFDQSVILAAEDLRRLWRHWRADLGGSEHVLPWTETEANRRFLVELVETPSTRAALLALLAPDLPLAIPITLDGREIARAAHS